jgi:hypothetical protein
MSNLYNNNSVIVIIRIMRSVMPKSDPIKRCPLKWSFVKWNAVLAFQFKTLKTSLELTSYGSFFLIYFFRSISTFLLRRMWDCHLRELHRHRAQGTPHHQVLRRPRSTLFNVVQRCSTSSKSFNFVKIVQRCSTSFKVVQNRSKSFKIVQNRSKSFKIVQRR